MIYELGILESSIHNKGKVRLVIVGLVRKKNSDDYGVRPLRICQSLEAKLKSLPKDEFTVNIIKCFSIQNTLNEERINRIKLHGFSFSPQFWFSIHYDRYKTPEDSCWITPACVAGTAGYSYSFEERRVAVSDRSNHWVMRQHHLYLNEIPTHTWSSPKKFQGS